MASPKSDAPVGRPSDYDPAFCAQVIELAKGGLSPAEIAAELGHPRTTMLGWADNHPEFSTALLHAKDFSLAWWEKQGRLGLGQGSAFNASLWKHSMTGRFPAEPYRDRMQVTGANDGPVQHVDLSNLSDERLEQLASILGEAGGVTGSDEAA